MFEQLLVRSNDAINDNMNQSAADIEITSAGSSFLWMVFSVMALTGFAIFVHANMLPKGDRVFHYLSVAILFTASVAYYSLASDLGATPITVEYLHGFNLNRTMGRIPTRQIWYARYIDWTVTTPLLLLGLLLVSGLPLSQVFMTLFLDEVMIVTGLIGALTISQYKWGYFAFANAAMFMVFWNLFFPGLKSASLLGKEFKKAYIISTGILSILWFLYPVAWGLADGANQISPDAEMVFYGILDLLAKPVFALVHLYLLRSCDLSKLRLQSGKFTEESQIDEKAEHHHHNGVSSQSSQSTNRETQAAQQPQMVAAPTL